MRVRFVNIVLIGLIGVSACAKKVEISNRPADAPSNTPNSAATSRHLRPVERSYFFGPDYAWLITGSGDMTRTTDGGATWQKFQIDPEGKLAGYDYELSFIDYQQG